MKTITLKPKKEESALRKHPWIFSGAIAKLPEDLQEGDKVRVVTSKGELIGVGHYQIGSIAVRLLDFADSDIDEKFFYTRINNALSLRKILGLIRKDNNCFRLVHGEGDYLPGLIVDIYGDTAVLQSHSPGMHFERFKISEALTHLEGINIRNVYYKSETTLPYKAQLDSENGYLAGHYDGSLALENGLLFNIDWLKGQKTGFFIDQRDNRQLLQKYSKDKKVLNMFCYTGGFSVYALRGEAKKVVSVDSSAKAISLTEANVALNFPACKSHESVCDDAFKYLGSIGEGEYDLIVLDPPAFAKHRSALKNGLMGYRKLNQKAFEKIAKGGLIFTFSCSQVVSKEMFRLAVFTAAVQSGRKVRLLHQLTQPADHPVDLAHPEGEYLKGLVLYVE